MKNSLGIRAKHLLLIYFLLTFLISWTGLVFIMGIDGFTGQKEVPDSQIPLLFLAMCAGPFIAGLLVNYFENGKASFKQLITRIGKWKVSTQWYAIALFSAPLLFGLTYVALSSFSSKFSPILFSTDDLLFLVLGGILGGIVAGFFEEIGWTGFAVPRLRQHFNIGTTGLIVGVIWGVWHLPLFMDSDPDEDIPLAILLIIKLVTHLPAFRILMVWVYDHTQSLCIIILMHMSLTTSTMIFQPTTTKGVDIVVFNLMFTGLIYVFMIMLRYLTFRLRSGFGTTSTGSV
ncbi:membrane protease YdiL (CAAX protease family) [Aquimarina sp. EL_43]|uniref:CPBP family intramembrane glutamic endopeptidase n=1 Tax=unclassified Aquimarina TaxID=2627091 RepID=UPI0018CB53DF|nr:MULTISPECIES: CPBP family intramembrane glutamic endopeptidase [unclassified Aquimarina]MBG6129423.1 membrane protease YdiL (CAAX protease family) [Aquimarina sp. EL_35]MBG6150488.1 membrane protease YdiL (CAAX protease family) [Aquimarina sp. EL_32]MBG6168204.1 membrane protease YdiL (CAAX protease family) [Aquimarina sp. EL_43]